jgi:hypothetical protein
MAKKSLMGEAADAVKSVAGAAIGAAAVAATGVVLGRVAGALGQGEKKLDQATPAAQKAMGDMVSKPILPAPKKRAAAKRKSTIAKKKATAKRAAVKKTRPVARRKKR